MIEHFLSLLFGEVEIHLWQIRGKSPGISSDILHARQIVSHLNDIGSGGDGLPGCLDGNVIGLQASNAGIIS